MSVPRGTRFKKLGGTKLAIGPTGRIINKKRAFKAIKTK